MFIKRNMVMMSEDYQGLTMDDDDNNDGDHEYIGLQEEEEGLKSNQQPIRRHRRNKKIPLIAVVGRPNVGKYSSM